MPAALTRTVARLAGGRELIYFDETRYDDRILDDSRDLATVIPRSRVRYDALLGEWVDIAGHPAIRPSAGSVRARSSPCPSTASNRTDWAPLTAGLALLEVLLRHRSPDPPYSTCSPR